jgi:tRNA pseudouridine32 synthase/23S rRNA pseudouridine746 synthase
VVDAADAALRVLAADHALVVADKPAGLLAVPGKGDAGRDHLAGRVQAVFADALVVHRLDMATSGLIVFARGPEVQRRLSIAFAERRVAKRYVAVVSGDVADDHGSIELPLAADWPNRPRQQVDPVLGKPSLTRWRVLSRDGGHTRLELEPVTGRSHQLRVHLAAIGHAIVGDALYAGEAAPRLLLHATSLAFAHPLSEAPLSFSSPPPF